MAKNRPSLPGAWHGLRRRMAEHRLFHRMIARQQINLASIQGSSTEAAIHRALETCVHCSAKGTCAAWLAGTDAVRNYARFCPNTKTIETLRAMAARRRA